MIKLIADINHAKNFKHIKCIFAKFLAKRSYSTKDMRLDILTALADELFEAGTISQDEWEQLGDIM